MARKNVTDSEIEVVMKPVHASLAKFLVKRQQVQDEEPEQTKKKPKKKAGRQRSGNSANRGGSISANPGGGVSGGQDDSGQTTLSEEERDYLQNVYKFPNLCLTGRKEKLALSADKSTRVKNSLVGNGLVVEFSVDLGKNFGGRVKMLMLTKKGYGVMGVTGENEFSPRQGSFEHIWWQTYIAKDYAQRHFRANIERVLNGKSADVGVQRGNEIVAVEVELTPKNALHNFKADTDAGFARVILACKNQNVKSQVEKKINAFIKDNPKYEGKARIMLLNEFPFVKSLKKEIRGY